MYTQYLVYTFKFQAILALSKVLFRGMQRQRALTARATANCFTLFISAGSNFIGQIACSHNNNRHQNIVHLRSHSSLLGKSPSAFADST